MILNGLDYDINNPKTDKNLFENYDVKSIDKKVKNKLELQKLLKLEVNPDIPMVGIVSRLVSQKGLDLIDFMMPEIVNENMQLVVLGTGDNEYQSMFHFVFQQDFYHYHLPKVYYMQTLFLLHNFPYLNHSL